MANRETMQLPTFGPCIVFYKSWDMEKEVATAKDP